MNLTNDEKVFVREITRDPRFAAIASKITTHTTVPAYAPGGDKDDGEKASRWKYRSGFVAGVTFALTTLGYEHER